VHKISLFANENNLSSSYFTALIFFNSIAVDSNFISKKSGENGHSCSVPDIKRNYFSFSPLSIMLAVGFSWVFITL
jgi:hypothetical protein